MGGREGQDGRGVGLPKRWRERLFPKPVGNVFRFLLLFCFLFFVFLLLFFAGREGGNTLYFMKGLLSPVVCRVLRIFIPLLKTTRLASFKRQGTQQVMFDFRNVYQKCKNNDNNNGYLERLTLTSPKRLHIL